MSRMQDQLEARIRDAHKKLRRYDNSLKELKAYFDERPNASAQALLHSLPDQLAVWRQYAWSRFGVDMEDWEQRQNHNWNYLADAWEYTLLAIKYDAFNYALELMIMLRDTGERGERLARLVCGAFLLAWSRIPGIMAVTIETYQKAVPHIANEAGLAEFLTAHLATHTSLRRNFSLRAGIDERREEGESRFARLLKELPAEALEAYDERPRSWGDLMDIRTEVARRLEKRDPPKWNANELAAFADREELLKRGKDAGLTPREYQLFALVMRDPERFLRRNYKLNHTEAAQAMGVAVGTTKSLWSRTKKKIFAA
jgi:hypothetical protein